MLALYNTLRLVVGGFDATRSVRIALYCKEDYVTSFVRGNADIPMDGILRRCCCALYEGKLLCCAV